MKITCTAYAYSRVNKKAALCLEHYAYMTVLGKMQGFHVFRQICLLKRSGYPEHCVYSEMVRYRSNMCMPIKWYVFARNCIGPSYFRQNLYIVHQGNFPCIWYIRAVPISVFLRGDSFCRLHLRVWKSHVLHMPIQGSIKRLLCVSNTTPIWLCWAKCRVFMFLDRLFVKTFRLSRALCLFRNGSLSFKYVYAN